MTIRVDDKVAEYLKRTPFPLWHLLIEIREGESEEETLYLTDAPHEIRNRISSRDGRTTKTAVWSPNFMKIQTVSNSISGAVVDREKFTIVVADSDRSVHKYFTPVNRGIEVLIRMFVYDDEEGEIGLIEWSKGNLSKVSFTPTQRGGALSATTTLECIGLFPKLDQTVNRTNTPASQARYDPHALDPDNRDTIFDFVGGTVNRVWGEDY